MFRLQYVIAQGPNIQRKECIVVLTELCWSGHCRLRAYVYSTNFAPTMIRDNTSNEDYLMITESCDLRGKCQDMPEGGEVR